MFTVYFVGYLTAATLLTGIAIGTAEEVESQLILTSEGGLSDDLAGASGAEGSAARKATLYSGPYVYDSDSGELLPATEVNLPIQDENGNAHSVFISLAGVAGSGGREQGRQEAESDAGRDGGSDEGSPDSVRSSVSGARVYATMEDADAGRIAVLDWGGNYNEDNEIDEILGDDTELSSENIAAYDEAMRASRAQSVDELETVLGIDGARLSAASEVSNVAYYAYPLPPWDSRGEIAVVRALEAAAPFLAYGGLAWIMFRRFYRKRIADPVLDLEAAANRIASRDLDFTVERATGSELGRLSDAFETMRASLSDAERELWRTAEDRHRLNAAFAHDLRTPVTVLKGTLEMASMRLAAGAPVEKDQLDKLSRQVDRLEAYAREMGSLSKLEDRALHLEDVSANELLAAVEEYARGCSRAWCGELAFSVANAGAENVRDRVLAADLPLIEEVLGNLLSNAATHAVSAVEVELGIDVAASGSAASLPLQKGLQVASGLYLVVRVHDDGRGFSDEALQRGCDPFFSERKGADHFGLGLNVTSMLAHLHGGEVKLANAPSGGALVEVTFEVDEGIVARGGGCSPAEAALSGRRQSVDIRGGSMLMRR